MVPNDWNWHRTGIPTAIPWLHMHLLYPSTPSLALLSPSLGKGPWGRFSHHNPS